MKVLDYWYCIIAKRGLFVCIVMRYPTKPVPAG